MALQLTENTFSAVSQVAKEPNIVLEIEGVPTLFGSLAISKYARIGDPDLIIGEPDLDFGAFYIGGFTLLDDQDNAITLDGTSNSIKQTLNIDKGEGGSITSLSIALVDAGDITRLITPGEIIPDILQARCRVYLGFENVAWPEDYVTIFRGVVTEVSSDPGKVTLQLNHPDDKKRSTIYKQIETTLAADISNSDTDIDLVSAANILLPIAGPDGNIDPSFRAYVRINDELILLDSINTNTLTGCTRGQINTTATSHQAGDAVTTFYRLTGTCTDLALKLMSSGFEGPYLEDIAVEQFGFYGVTSVPNSLQFLDYDVSKYNIQVGDYVTVTGATEAANNFTGKQVLDVVTTEDGSYIVIDGVSLVDETSSAAVMSVRSKYDTLPNGLRMVNEEIDIAEHDRLNQLFLSNISYDIYLKETIENAKEFLEEQIYSPAAAYSLPRKSRASLGYHIGPIPGQDIKTLSYDNVKRPSQMRLKRSTNRQFYNEVVYRFDESALEDKFLTGFVNIAQDSKDQIRGPNKTLTVSAKGLRSTEQGEAIAQSQSERRLNRYKFAAESIEVATLFDVGFNIEIGDIVVYDGTNLALPDIKTGSKGMAPRLFEVQNKDLNLKTGDVRLEIVDTNFDGAGRYCLMSPSSFVAVGISTTELIIKQSFSARFGVAEWRKWQDQVGASVRIRSSDFSIDHDTVITAISGNTFTVSPALPVVPAADQVFEMTLYTDVDVTEQTKLVYGFMSDAPFADGPQYQML